MQVGIPFHALPILGPGSLLTKRYGISNRGGRWKNGKKLGIRNRVERVVETAEPTVVSVTPWTDFQLLGNPSPPTQYIPTDESVITSWEKSLNSDIWTYDQTTTTVAFPQYSMPPTPSTLSFSSRRNSGWPAEMEDANTANANEPNYPQEVYPMNPTPSSERQAQCSCFVIMLQMLQNLHQNFPQSLILQPAALSALNYAAVLNINEEATACCSSMLRCSYCQRDDSDSFTIMASLIRKVLSLTEAWVATPTLREGGECRSSTASQAEQEEERRIKAEISLIGIRKMEEVLVPLKQAGQGLRADYERLICASLAASLGTRLKCASKTLGEMSVV
jgi:hypothetical protein